MTRERRPVEPLGGGRERQRIRRRPAWQEQHQGMQGGESGDGGGHAEADLQNLHDVEQQPQGYHQPAHQPYPPQQDEYHPPYDEELEPRTRRRVHRDDDDGSSMGLLMFVLIFGVGNWLLYKYTGWLIIPIPRK